MARNAKLRQRRMMDGPGLHLKDGDIVIETEDVLPAVPAATAMDRGSFAIFRYYGVSQDAEGCYPPIKRRLLIATKEWLGKGLLTDAEVRALLPRV